MRIIHLLAVLGLVVVTTPASSAQANETLSSDKTNGTDVKPRFSFGPFGVFPGFGGPPGFGGIPGFGGQNGLGQGGGRRFPQNQGFSQNQNAFPQNQNGFPPNQNGFPQNQNGFQQNQNGFPQNQNGFQLNQNGFPPNQNGFQLNQNGFPQNQNGFPPNQNGFPQNQNQPGLSGGRPGERPQNDNWQGVTPGIRPGNRPQQLQNNIPGDQSSPTNIRPFGQGRPNRADDFRPVQEDTFESNPPSPPFIQQQDALAAAGNNGNQDGDQGRGDGIFFPGGDGGPGDNRPTSAPQGSGPLTFPTLPSSAATTTPIPFSSASRRTTTTLSPAGTTPVSPCVMSCQTTLEFNPVCGNDGVTYPNPGKLKCAQKCGNRVSMLHSGTCRT